MSVFVLDRHGKPLMPCSEKRAKLMLARGRARVHRIVPFVIRLTDRLQEASVLQIIEVKIDPGSKHTGIAVVIIDGKAVNVRMLLELTHRGELIKRTMVKRATLRRGRRRRNTRYRKIRFSNRARPKGWLAPSLRHRVLTTMSWVNRIRRWCPVEALAYECVNFDMQRMMNQNISGKQYQQGELYKKELMEYLLEKFERKCVYCNASDVRLEIEHSTPRALGGSDSVRNLLLACRDCNQKKGALPLHLFLIDKPELLSTLRKRLRAPLKDVASSNSTKNALFKGLLRTNLPVSISTGAQTKLNRDQFDVPKMHATDAACVGNIESIRFESVFTLEIKSTGRGKHQRVVCNKFGFPKSYGERKKHHFGFTTGDIARFTATEEQKRIGILSCIKRISVRSSGVFSIVLNGVLVSRRHYQWKLLQKADGYSYNLFPYQMDKIIHLGSFIHINGRIFSS